MRRILGFAGLLTLLCVPAASFAHGGRTDSLGCHHNRKAGGYHCHSGPLAGRSFSSKSQAQAALRKLRSPSSEKQEKTERSTAKTLTASEAKDHIGQRATVCGRVASARYAASSRGQPTFLNLDRAYPNHVFTMVIWGENRAKFGKPEEKYRDKEICVTGTIESYRGVPQIVLRNPEQLRMKGKAESPKSNSGASGKSQVEAIQTILAMMGYKPGPIDGILGLATRRALRNLQTEYGLTPTGEIDKTTLTVMEPWLQQLASTRRSRRYRRAVSVECDGYNSETGEYVYGECIDGTFEGYDSATGNYVYGDCEPGGDLDAYDSDTGAYIYGECEEP